MPLNKVQLMTTPGGPGTIGAVKGSSTITVDSDGTLRTSSTLILPNQSGSAGKVLSTDGNGTLSWITAGGTGGGITFVGFDPGTSGLQVTGSPINAPGGTIKISGGALAIGFGGTGATTATGVLTNILPSQTGQAGKFLTTNGNTVSWAAAGGGGGGVSQILSGLNINVDNPSSATPTVNVVKSPSFEGKITGQSGLEIKGGGIDSQPGGTVTDPGFLLSQGTDTFRGGLYLDSQNNRIGMTVGENRAGMTSVFEVGKGSCFIRRSLTVDGGGLTVSPGGGITAPGIAISNPGGTIAGGLYLDTANGAIGLSIQKVSVIEAASNYCYIRRALRVDGGGISQVGGGSVSAPGFSISNAAGSLAGGIYLNLTGGSLGLACQGKTILESNGDNTVITGSLDVRGNVLFQGGSASVPGLRFRADPDTGIFQVGSDANSELGFTINGNQVGQFGPTSLTLADNVGIDCVKVYNTPLASSNKVVVNTSGVFGINTNALESIQDVQGHTYGLNEVMQLTSKTYATKGATDSSERYLGVIADEVADVMPECVNYGAEGQPLSVDELGLVSVLMEAVKELNERLESLQSEFDAYRAKA